jgi:pyruvate-formate lyase-activating enzyme
MSESRQPLQNDLEPLLGAAEFGGGQIEVLMNLALGPASIPDLRFNAKLTDDEDAQQIVDGLCARGVVERGDPTDPRYRLVGARSIEACLPGVAGRRLALLARSTRADFVPAVVLNPTLPDRGDHLEGAHAAGVYARYRADFDARLPQVEVRTQTVCNLGCVYCYIRKDPRDNQSTGQLLEQFRRAAAGGVDRLILTGGESTLRKDLPRLIRGARRAGFVDVQLFTNGLVFAYPEPLAAVMEAGLTALCLHASTTDARLYERLTRRDRFAALEMAVANLERYPELEITVLSVVNRLNLDHLSETVAYFRDWQRRVGFKRFVTQLIHCCVYSSSWDHRDTVLGPLAEGVGMVRKVVEAHRGEPWPITYQNIPICLMPGLEAHSYDLYLTFARQLVASGRFDFTPLDTMFTKPTTCRPCVHEPYCLGLPRGYVRLFGSDELRPVRAASAGSSS